MKTFDTINHEMVALIRAEADGTGGYNVVEYGGRPDPVVGTGRATCRCCGHRIKKGQPAWRFYWDFHGSGSWTATQAQIHRDEADCLAAKKTSDQPIDGGSE